MFRRSFRHVLLAVLATAAGLAIVAGTGGGPAGAATVTQALDCGVGGTQTMTVIATAPGTVTTGGTYTVQLDSGSGKADGAEIKNMVTTFHAPVGSTLVPGSATLIGTGTGTVGNVTAKITGTTVSITVPGPIANGATFDPPPLQFQLQATGAVGTVLAVKARQSAAYTLTAAGSFNVSCNAVSPLSSFTSTTIQAAVTTTTAPTTTASTTTTSRSRVTAR